MSYFPFPRSSKNGLPSSRSNHRASSPPPKPIKGVRLTRGRGASDVVQYDCDVTTAAVAFDMPTDASGNVDYTTLAHLMRAAGDQPDVEEWRDAKRVYTAGGSSTIAAVRTFNNRFAQTSGRASKEAYDAMYKKQKMDHEDRMKEREYQFNLEMAKLQQHGYPQNNYNSGQAVPQQTTPGGPRNSSSSRSKKGNSTPHKAGHYYGTESHWGRYY